MPLSSRAPHRTVDRIAQILEIAAREPSGATLTEIAGRLGAPVSSIQVLVNGLVAASFLDERDKRFLLGPTPYVLNVIAGRTPVRSVQHAELERLAEETGAAVALGVAVGHRLVYIDHVERGNPAIAYAASMHLPRPLIRTACGRALLAFSDRRDVFGYLRSVDPADQQHVDSFLAEMDEIRATGMAMSHGYIVPGNSGVAVPVVEDDRAVAAITAVGRSEEIEGRLAEIGQILRARTTAGR